MAYRINVKEEHWSKFNDAFTKETAKQYPEYSDDVELVKKPPTKYGIECEFRFKNTVPPGIQGCIHKIAEKVEIRLRQPNPFALS